MSDITSGLFGDVLNAVQNAKNGQKAVRARQISIIQSASKAAFYDKYLESFTDTQDEQFATKAAQDSAQYVEDELKEIIRIRKHEEDAEDMDEDASGTNSQPTSGTPSESSFEDDEESVENFRRSRSS
jgi:hypothetical protein